MSAGAHDVQQQCRIGEADISVDREEVGLMDKLIRPVPAVLGEPHVGTFGEALVGETGSGWPSEAD